MSDGAKAYLYINNVLVNSQNKNWASYAFHIYFLVDMVVIIGRRLILWGR